MLVYLRENKLFRTKSQRRFSVSQLLYFGMATYTNYTREFAADTDAALRARKFSLPSD